MREIPWSLLLGFVLAALALPALAYSLAYEEDGYINGEIGGRDETENQQVDQVRKRALIALSRFKPFASALTSDIHRYAARSYLANRDANSMTFEERRGRPAQNPMRFGR